MTGAHREQGDGNTPLADGSVPAEDDARLRRADEEQSGNVEVSAEDARLDAEARAATLYPHRPA